MLCRVMKVVPRAVLYSAYIFVVGWDPHVIVSLSVLAVFVAHKHWAQVCVPVREALTTNDEVEFASVLEDDCE